MMKRSLSGPYPPQPAPGYGMAPPAAYPPPGGMAPPGYAPGPGLAPPPQVVGWAAAYYTMLTPQALAALQQWFVSVDLDRSGSISAGELATVQFNGYPIGLPVAAKLIKVFDRDHSGTIDFMEYATLHQFMQHMQSLFFQADRDRSGYLDPAEILPALLGAGFQLSLPTIQAKFSVPGRGVDFPNYLYICAHLAHIRSIFEWNDQARQGRIMLTFDNLALIGTDIL